MNSELNHRDTRPSLPDVLTVEEAARLMRIGRTKAYAMTQEWRATGGRSGLPVVDLGDVLRVPRRALEQLLGVEFTPTTSAPPAAPRPASTERQRQPKRNKSVISSQLELFNPPEIPSA